MRPDPLSDDELADIKRRAEQATPGPWVHVSEGIIETENPSRRIVALTCKGSNRVSPPLPAAENGAFISNARTDVLRLIAEIERLKSLINGHATPHPDRVQR
jgi:hypothetical protein